MDSRKQGIVGTFLKSSNCIDATAFCVKSNSDVDLGGIFCCARAVSDNSFCAPPPSPSELPSGPNITGMGIPEEALSLVSSAIV